MFDFGFWELVVVGLVALLVVGPERLPRLAREVGRWVGKIKQFVTSVRSDIEQEIKADELRRMLEDQEKEIHRLKTMMEDTEQDLRREVHQAQDKAESAAREAGARSGEHTSPGETPAKARDD
ncbi:Sec-independent protein translocase protein TatB [Ectothiorhodospira mobilis]|uniref:Sec-independent protein translocase protein TatB n=1 Tax=Ectothiorhodospira mobilis TaxID=195064 RepID=A0A1I4R4A6_ECTMO|nr:Sec-independent protein translocase TatB [Ectothiorhodospira mobilis]